MSCDAIRTLLPDALTGPIEEDARASVEAHLARCEACRREADELARVVALVRREAPPAGEVLVPSFGDVLIEVRSARRRVAPLLLRVAALVLAVVTGGAIERFVLARPAPAPTTLARERAREALAGNPGGLGSSLAVLHALSRAK